MIYLKVGKNSNTDPTTETTRSPEITAECNNTESNPDLTFDPEPLIYSKG